MKIKSLLHAALVAVAAGQSARADVTINVTGATAFRKAAIDAIQAIYAAGGSYNYTTSANGSGSNVINAASATTFSGTFSTIPGVTTIRTSWNGSVEGIRALIYPGATYSAKYIPSAGSGTNFSTSATTQYAADFAFSDVLQGSTPELSPTLDTVPVGIVVFGLIANQNSALTNISTTQLKDLFKNGYTKKSVITGNSLDTTRVYLVGRNDGSGTRTTYLAATGYGVTNTVKQYAAVTSTSAAGGSISQIQLVPGAGNGFISVNGGATDATFQSTIWGNSATDGNGGYQSGGTLVTAMTNSTPSCQVLNADGTSKFSAASLDLVTWVGAGDIGSNLSKVKVLSYNGVSITVQSSGPVIDATSKAKIVSGQYDAWGTENLLYKTTAAPTGDYLTFKTQIVNKLTDTTIVDASGITLGEMKVSRVPTDGGVIQPKLR